MDRSVTISLFILCILSTYAHGARMKRVAGGQAIPIVQTPHMAAFLLNNTYGCSGAVISSNKILTTASCILNKYSDDVPIDEYLRSFTVKVGSSRISQGATVYGVKSFRPFDGYKVGDFSNNVAVVTLTSKISFTEKAKPAELPDSDYIELTIGTACGWGVTETKVDPPMSDVLLCVDLEIKSRDKCREAFKAMSDRDMCAIAMDRSAGLCMGDSGSPLVQYGKVVGISTFGFGRYCSHGFQNYFVNVYKYLDFIKTEIDQRVTEIPKEYVEHPELIWTD